MGKGGKIAERSPYMDNACTTHTKKHLFHRIHEKKLDNPQFFYKLIQDKINLISRSNHEPHKKNTPRPAQ